MKTNYYQTKPFNGDYPKSSTSSSKLRSAKLSAFVIAGKMKHLLLVIAIAVLVGCGNEKTIKSVNDAYDRFGLWAAVVVGDRDAVKRMVKTATKQEIQRALDEALADDQHDMLDLLLVDGVVPSTQNLNHAIREGDLETMEKLLKHGADPNAERGGYTAILNAIADGNESIVSSLIDHGASLQNQGSPAWTPLNYASFYDSLWGRIDIVKILIKKGADVNLPDVDGVTALDIAIGNDRQELTKLLKENGAKSGAEKSLFAAARVGNLDAVQKHIANGVDVNLISKDGDSILSLAQISGDSPDSPIVASKKKIVSLLREHGAKGSIELIQEGESLDELRNKQQE